MFYIPLSLHLWDTFGRHAWLLLMASRRELHAQIRISPCIGTVCFLAGLSRAVLSPWLCDGDKYHTCCSLPYFPHHPAVVLAQP